MRVMEDMKELLEDQLKKISKKGDAISPQELDNAYKAVDIIKDITTIEAMQRAEKQEEEMKKEMEGYSQARGRGGRYSMHMPMYEDMLSYDGGGSGRFYPIMNPSYASTNSYDGSYTGGGQSRDGGASREGASRDGGQSNEYSEEYSERRGRSPRTGRYVSRDMSRDGASYDGASYEYSRADEQQEKEQLKQQIKQMQQKLNNM